MPAVHRTSSAPPATLMSLAARTRRLAWPLATLSLAGLTHGSAPLAAWASAWLPAVAVADIRIGAGIIAWLAAAWAGLRLFEVAATAGGRTVPRVLIDLVGVVLFLGAAIAIQAHIFDQSITGLLTTSGVAVAVLGFALRDVIGDVFSGIALNIEHPFKLDDWLEVEPGGPVGRVVEINWRATRLITLDETMVVVPNTHLATRRFINFSTPQRRFRATLPVVLDYAVPAERAHQVLTVATRGVASILADPASDVIADAYTEHGIRYLVRFWVADYGRLMPCKNEVSLSLHRHLRLAGIGPAHARMALTVRRDGDRGAEGAGVAGLLAQVELFRCLDAEDLAMLGGGLDPDPVTAGAEIVSAGAPGTSLFVIIEGLATVSRDGAV